MARRQPLWLAAYYHLAFWVCLAVFGLTCLAWSLPATLLFPLLRRFSWSRRLGQAGIAYGLRFPLGVMRLAGVLRVDWGEVDRLREEAPLVIAPNHPSMLDAILLISRLPRVVCITKASLWDNFFLGGGIRLAGYVRNDEPLPMIRRAAAAAAAGSHLLIFPEGSRTTARPVDPLHRSFGVLARAAGRPVQAVLIEAGSPYLAKGWPLLRPPPLPLVYRFRLGARFEPGRDPEAMLARLETHYRAELPA
jgi:1-acyl-sn-glycerol-3-phosphate acyltransferase